ncbi:MAG TPA: formate dehydrogenase accessory protein FdhE [Candidatus Acidoferrum sp.]|jgi:FdhE protein
MTFLAATRVNYSGRLARAELLSKKHSFAAEILTFYAKIAEFQKSFYEGLPKKWGKHLVVPADGNLRSELNLFPILQSFGDFLSLVGNSAPAPLATEARTFLPLGKLGWSETLQEFWKQGLHEGSAESARSTEAAPNPLSEFLCRAYIQPYAEFVAGAMLPFNLSTTVCRCPRCNSLPLLAVLRPEGDGAKRFLQCALCSQEWDFRRIFCAFCGEEEERKLPVFVSEQFPHIRVESCQTCKRYLRSIDLTKDGNAIPMVDDLSAIPLSLWAEEQGLRRIQSNLLGT